MTDKNNEIVMLVGNGCPACANQKKILKTEIKTGKIKLLDINTSEGARLVEKQKLKYIPQILRKDKKTNKYKKCELIDGYIVCGKNKLKI